MSVVQDESPPFAIDILTREISFNEGYELAFFTLKRLHDGHLQSYMPVNARDLQVRFVPVETQLSELEQLEKLPEDFRADQNNAASHSSSSYQSSGNPPPHSHTPKRHTHSIPIHGGHDTVGQPDERFREPSVVTLGRRAHARDDGYTDVCGLRFPEVSIPVRKDNPGKGEFRCPRCGSNFTRPKSVKDHFPYCISKYGNPQALRFTDHPSMAQTEVAIQRRTRASRESSAVTTEESDSEDDDDGTMMDDDDARMDEHSPEIEFKEMNEAL